MQPKHPEIHPAFAGADVADALEQVVEVVWHARPGRILQPLIVEHEAFDEILLEASRGPLAELGAARGTHPVTNGHDHFQTIVFDRACNASGAFRTNY